MDKVIYLLKTAWDKDKKLLLIVVGQNLFEAIISIIDILGIGIIVNALITGAGEKTVFSTIIMYILINTSISLIREFFTWVRDIEQRKSTNNIQYMYAWQSLAVDFKYIQSGDFLNLKRKAHVTPAFYISHFGRFVSYIVKFIGIMSMFSYINPFLMFGIVIFSILPIILSFKQKKAEYEYKSNITQFELKGDYLYKTMTEYSYAKDIRIYGGKEIVCKKYISNCEEQIKRQSALGLKNVIVKNIAFLCSSMQLLCMMIVFSYMVYKNEITLAEYTVLLSSTVLFSTIIIGFFENIADIKALCNYISIMKEYDELISNNSKVYCNTNMIKYCDLHSISIDFEHVCFKYPGSENIILNDVSFHIDKGEKISFVGLNGAGKSTIIQLLLRLYEPTSGKIKINGIDIQNIDSKKYYEHIGIVLQDFFLFAYSVAENICFDKTPDVCKIEDMMKQIGLDKRIACMPNGLHTSLYKNLDENGIELSGGEGQKIAMVRALYKDSSLLIFDEPTSSLDPMSEYELFSNMRDMSKNNTTIMISHRLSSTRYCDRIFVFESGELIQSGTHNELMNVFGVYKDLFLTQSKYYTGEGKLYAE